MPRPPAASAPVWHEALARNPDPAALVPVPLVGAPALHARIVAQQEQAHALAAHAGKLRETARFLEAARRGSRDGLRHAGIEREALRRRLLDVMRKVEIVRCMGQPTQRAEGEARRRLGALDQQARAVGQSLAELEERARQQARAWRRRRAARDAQPLESGAAALTQEDKAALFNVMSEQKVGLERLADIVKRDVRDVGIVKDELSKASSVSVHALPPSGPVVFGR